VINIGLYPVGGAQKFYVLNDNVAGNAQKAPVQRLVTGTAREQDVITTFQQSTEGAATVAQQAPTSPAAWRGFPGTLGLFKQSDAPGDLTRAWISDLDNTRPGQLTAWLQWPDGATVTVDADGVSSQPVGVDALVNTAASWGFVAQNVAGTRSSYWSWNGTKFALQRQVQARPQGTANFSSRLPSSTSMGLSGTYAPLIVNQTDTSLWMPLGVGAVGSTDISVGLAAGVGVANAYHTFVYFDILFVVSVTGGNITVTPYRPRIPGAGNVLQSATLNGLANALLTIPGEAVCMGVVVCEGAVYLCSDRAVYGIQWNDQNNTFLSTKLFELPQITGTPVVWNGEVYIPAGGRIAHIVPNQRGFDWRVPDPNGKMPPRYNAFIIQLQPMTDYLVAYVLDYLSSGMGTILLMDANGVWSCLYQLEASLYRTGIVPVVDGTHPEGIAFFNGTSSILTASVLPLPSPGRDPHTLIVGQRKQRAGAARLISPFFDLEVEGAQKLLQRFAQEVLDASSTYPIRAYYQTDFADEGGSDTFTTGCAKGTGTWHKCFYAAANSTAYAGSTDSGGHGQLWYEFDNATNYTGDTIGFLPIYPLFKRVRFCLEVNGDTTGNTIPTINSTLFHRVEFVTKAFQRQYVVRLRQGDITGISAAYGGSTSVALASSTAVVTELNTLKGYDSAKTKLTEINERGESRTVIMTKFDDALSAVNSDGTPSEYICTFTVLDAALSGLT
jgi:hypothetical protein